MCLNPGVQLRVLSHALVVLVYCAGYLGTLFPLRFLMVYVLIGLIASLKRLVGADQGYLLLALAVATTTALVALYAVGWVTWWTPAGGERIVRYLLLFTCAYWAGRLMRKHGLFERFWFIYLFWSVVAGVFAVIEFARDKYLVERTDFLYPIVRAGHLRAALLAEHPLVLATLLAIAIPAAVRLRKPTWRIAASVVVIAGIYCTQSRGPLAAALIYLGTCAVFGRRGRSAVTARSMVVPAAVFVVMGVVAALLVSPFLDSGDLRSTDPAQASLEYRVALYAHVGRSLAGHPWGWGPAGLPHGTYLIQSALGALDVADTVDSELVLLTLEYGALGLVAFLAIASLMLDRVLRLADAASDALAILVFCSLFLAIHSWTGLGSVAFLLVACALHVGRPAEVDQGLPADVPAGART